MSDEASAATKRDPIKSSVGNVAAQRRRQHAVTIGRERREALMRTKRLCRDGIENDETPLHEDIIVDVEQAALDVQTSRTVSDLKAAISLQGKGSMQKKVEVLRGLRRLLSRSEIPPVEAAIQAGVIPILSQCLSFGSPDEQLLEAAWCLTNIAAGEPTQTRSLLPVLPLLVAHLGEKSSMPVAEQCAWALGNVAGEGEELRNVLLAQGTLPALARMVLSNKVSTARTAGWALSNLIKGPDPRAASELVKIEGVLDAIMRHLRKSDDELATEIAWVVVYISALSNTAANALLKTDIIQLLVDRLATAESLQLLIPVLRSLGNLIAGDGRITSDVLLVGHEVTGKIIFALVKCLGSEHRVLKKEACWVLSNIAAGSLAHKQLIYSSEATALLIRFLCTAPFDIKKEAAYALGNLCVAPMESQGQPSLIVDHLASLVSRGCLPGFISLVRSPDYEAARLGLQFLELVLRGLPNGEGPILVENEDGIDAMERFQFHENEELRNMANGLVDKYFGVDYGIDE